MKITYVLLAAVFAASISSCASFNKKGSYVPPTASHGDKGEMYYVTSRAPTSDKSKRDVAADRYTSKQLNDLDYGVLKTSYNKHDGTLVSSPGPVKVHTKATFVESLQSEVESGELEHLVVFVHGYNVDFREAYEDGFFIDHSLRSRKARCLVYSWPSRGTTSGYLSDESRIKPSGRQLGELLKLISDEIKPKKLSVVAHSMGSRVVLEALQLGYRDHLSSSSIFNIKPLDHLVLAAPDVGKEEFDNPYVQDATKLTKHFSIYVSKEDRALKLSRKIHFGSRIGEMTANDLCYDNVDIIDTSALENRDFIKHGYILSNDAVHKDLLAALITDASARSRITIQESKGYKCNHFKVWTVNR